MVHRLITLYSLSSARERTGARMRDKATIRRLQMYRTGGKVVRSVPALFPNGLVMDMYWLLYTVSNTMLSSSGRPKPGLFVK